MVLGDLLAALRDRSHDGSNDSMFTFADLRRALRHRDIGYRPLSQVLYARSTQRSDGWPAMKHQVRALVELIACYSNRSLTPVLESIQVARRHANPVPTQRGR